jgi:hypothetical protein
MIQRIFLSFFALCISFLAAGQTDTSHLRISLLTCGAGNEEVYEVFGHTAVRVTDSVKGTDLVYNYGTFAYGPDFEFQFAKGKLLYYVSAYPYPEFVAEYASVKRSVEEQELLLSGEEKERVYAYLDWNAQPDNKYYKYDFFFDNCATRIRDIFPRVLGKDFKFGQTIPPNSKMPYRDIMNQYFFMRHWERLGCNILLGSKIDKVMSNEAIMFLPDYLRDGVGGGTVNGRKIAAPRVLVVPGSVVLQSGPNYPLYLSLLIAVLTIAGLSIKKLRPLGRIMTFLLLFVTGLLGCLILVMWFGTDHQACRNNFNILWMLPLNLLIPFRKPKGVGKYSVIAILLILISLLLHLFKVQGLVIEFLPVMLALLFVFGTIYKRNLTKQSVVYARD